MWLSGFQHLHSTVQSKWYFAKCRWVKRDRIIVALSSFFPVLKELGHLKNTKSYRRDWKSQMMLVLAICDRAQELLIRQRVANYSYPWWSESGVSTERAGGGVGGAGWQENDLWSDKSLHCGMAFWSNGVRGSVAQSGLAVLSKVKE